jgi:hypothetical protein
VEEELIAPCGMNCGICTGYLSFKYAVSDRGLRMPSCPGCRPRNKNCAFLKKRCSLLIAGAVQYCYQCDDFPCKNLEHLDKRYRNLYRMSMIENLEYIKKEGIRSFLQKETDKWKCPDCREIICCHNGICYNCGLEKLKTKKKLYRWEDD